MKKLLNSFLLLSLIMGLVSCAKEVPKTKAKISIGAAIDGDAFPGGLYILGHTPEGSNETVFVKRIQGNSFEIELPNGKWEFGAFGWKGQNGNKIEPISGDIKCYFSNRFFELDGAETDIALNLSKANCDDEFFGPEKLKDSNDPTQPKELVIDSCAYLNKDSKECSSGNAKSFKVVLYDYNFSHPDEMFNQRQNPFYSKCILKNNKDLFNIRLPALPIPFNIISYTDENCSSGALNNYFKYGLEDEKAFDDIPHGAEIFNDSLTLFINSDVCKNNSSSNPFESTLPGVGARFYICNSAQLKTIGSNANFPNNAQYLIGKDIDMANYTMNDNPFSGILDGRNKTLFNISSPLFASLDQGVRINNLNLKNININQNIENLGILAQSLNLSSGQARISNITINNANLTGTENIGGLIGLLNSNAPISRDALLENIQINPQGEESNFNITGTSYLGGLIGRGSNFSVRDSEFSGTITGYRFIGGLGGEISGTEIMKYKSHLNVKPLTDNTVPTYCSFIGGIAGETINGSSEGVKIRNIFSDLTINQSATSVFCQNVGGVVGKVYNQTTSGPTKIENARVYFSSDLNSASGNTNHGGIAGQVYCESNTVDFKSSNINIDLSGSGIQRGGIVGLATEANNNDCIDSTASEIIVSANINTTSGSAQSPYIGSGDFIYLDKIRAYTETSLTTAIANGSGNNIKLTQLFNNADFYLPDETTRNNSPEIWDSNSNFEELKFSNALLQLSPQFSGSAIPNFHVGNSFEPLQISNAEDWRLIANNTNLYNKTIELVSNISFNNSSSEFVSIGAPSFPFIGEIIPNGHSLSNIVMDGSLGQNGIFGSLGSYDSSNPQTAFIGSHHDPLKIYEVSLNNATANSGIVAGVINDAHLVVRVEQASIESGNEVSAIGGLAGQVSDRAQIFESSFSGNINTPNATEVGAFVGQVNSPTSTRSFELKFSKARLDQFSSDSTLNLFVGSISTQDSVNIKQNYVSFNPTVANSSYSFYGGESQVDFVFNVINLRENERGLLPLNFSNNLTISNNTNLDDLMSSNQFFFNNAKEFDFYEDEFDNGNTRVGVKLYWEYNNQCDSDTCN